jgi:hypothetical protein
MLLVGGGCGVDDVTDSRDSAVCSGCSVLLMLLDTKDRASRGRLVAEESPLRMRSSSEDLSVLKPSEAAASVGGGRRSAVPVSAENYVDVGSFAINGMFYI